MDIALMIARLITSNHNIKSLILLHCNIPKVFISLLLEAIKDQNRSLLDGTSSGAGLKKLAFQNV